MRARKTLERCERRAMWIADPLTSRYLKGPFLEQASERMSDEALYLDYCVRVELSLLTCLARRGYFEAELVEETRRNCAGISFEEVQAEEERVRHDLKAVVNLMVGRAPKEVKPFIHLGATSYDILSNAHALRLRDGVQDFVLKALKEVAAELHRLAELHADTPYIGRTHGQYAEPLSFGYSMAVYLDRLGFEIEALENAARGLRGKFSGAVGGYVALGLLFDDARQFEAEVLAELGLEPHLTSTQIVHPESALRAYHHLAAAFGVLANLADDMRHLQRSEIAEVAERYESKSQVGSSAMPHKQNPITWENIKSLWKVFIPQLTTAYMDQVSEHQRDLTNSASARFMPRLILGLLVAATRARKALSQLVVCQETMAERLDALDKVVSGPAQVLLSSVGHPDAHEQVRKEALGEGPLLERLEQNPSLAAYLVRLSTAQRDALTRPAKLTTPSAQAARNAAAVWKERLDL